MKKNLFVTALLLGVSALAFAQSNNSAAQPLYALTAVLAVTQPQTNDETAVRSLFTTMEKAWNGKSGEAFSSIFADVHDYIVVNGLYFTNWNPKANAAAHQGLFNGIYKTRDIRLKVDKVSWLRPDLALVTVLAGQYDTGGAPPKDPSAIMTVIAEKKGTDWKIISFHNHSLEQVLAMKQTPMPLEVMYASWYK
jgi:uncharacterized protein (TIGR02246 family)